MGQLALLSAGTLIGNAFGAGWLGALVGGAAGALLFGEKKPDTVGPRLNDLHVMSGAYGAPIQFGFGTARADGQLIWSPGIIEHSKKSGGSKKGAGFKGPSETSYSYTCSMAIA